jgi:hypothetical protein
MKILDVGETRWTCLYVGLNTDAAGRIQFSIDVGIQ